MAMIQCALCGKDISSKAKECPYCGAVLMGEGNSGPQEENQTVICEECGSEVSGSMRACPNCGCPITEKAPQEKPVQRVELAAVSLPGIKRGTRKRILVGGMVFVLLIAAVAVGLYSQRQKELKEAARLREEYSETMKLASLSMLMGASDAEEAGNLIRLVWYNSIYEERDAKTDKYTRPNGYFYNDFNDAIKELFNDSEFQSTVSSIEENQNTVADLMRSLKTPPDEYKDAYDAIKVYYDSYLVLTNLAINPKGNLQSFTSDFNDADNSVLNAYNAAKLYIED